MATEKSAAVKVAESKRANISTDGAFTLSSGVHVTFSRVPQTLILDAQELVEIPQVPMWFNSDKERDEENPLDPNYVKAVAAANRKQGMAALDTMIMFGVELVGGLPKDDRWLRKLKLLEAQGHISLGAYDLEDDLHLEFLYKKHIAITDDDYDLVSEQCNMLPSEEEKAQAAESFPGDEEGTPDSPGQAQETD